jgi:hypothetical protein
VVVYGQFRGAKNPESADSEPPFSNDIALVHLASPFPSTAMQPALLATEKDFSSSTTLAGYGYSNAEGGIFGQFALTWPVVPVERKAGELSFSPKKEGR